MEPHPEEERWRRWHEFRCQRNSRDRPKEFSGREEDFLLWSKKTEAFFAGVIKESEMMLEWSGEQTTEIATELINCKFLPTETSQE